MEKKRRLFLLLFLLGLATSLSAYKLLSSSSIEIIEFTNGRIIESPYPFYYQDTEHPKVELLRAKVEPAVKGISSEWEKLIAIRKWVKNQWEHGEPELPVSWDASNILARAQKGERFFCAQYAIVYLQTCAALGLPTRIVELYDENLASHAVVEVWSNDWNKWVVMDIDYNCYYVKDDLPLSALELHNAWLNAETNLIRTERNGATTLPNPCATSGHLLNYYNHLLFVFRNDFLTLEVPLKEEVPGLSPQWIDKNTSPLPFVPLRTNRPPDLYYTLNQVKIDPGFKKLFLKRLFYLEQNSVKVQLTHNVPNFDKYLIRINQARDWDEGTSPFEWQIKKGLNTLEVKARNKAGVDGPVSRVVLRLD